MRTPDETPVRPSCDLAARAPLLVGPGRPCPPARCTVDLGEELLRCDGEAASEDGVACTVFERLPLDAPGCPALCAPDRCEPGPGGAMSCTSGCGLTPEGDPRTCFLVGEACEAAAP